MNRLEHALLSFAFLAISPAAMAAESVTGSWDYFGRAESGLWLKTIQTGTKVKFQLEISRGSPSYNSGFIEGEFELDNNKATFKPEDYPECEITFEFSRTKVKIAESENTRDCGFGFNVRAHGTLSLKNHKVPKFSDGAP